MEAPPNRARVSITKPRAKECADPDPAWLSRASFSEVGVRRALVGPIVRMPSGFKDPCRSEVKLAAARAKAVSAG